MTAHDLW